MIHYKGYRGSFEFDLNTKHLVGKVTNIARGTISFRGQSIPEIEKAMADAIDRYLRMCEQEGVEPLPPEPLPLDVRPSASDA